MFKIKCPPPTVNPPDYGTLMKYAFSKNGGKVHVFALYYIWKLTISGEWVSLIFSSRHKPDLLCVSSTEGKSTPAGDVKSLQLVVKSFIWRSMWSAYNKPNFFIKNVNTDKTTCWNVTKLSASQPSKNWFEVPNSVSRSFRTCFELLSPDDMDWKKHKLESRLLREISITSDTQMTPPLWQKVKRN